MLTTAVMEIFVCMQWLLKPLPLQKTTTVQSIFTYLSHFPADEKLILFSDQSVSCDLRYTMKILHFYANQSLFNFYCYFYQQIVFF